MNDPPASLTEYRILCLSHLRWETTLFQRPQQLMTRFDAMGIPVVYISQGSTRRWARTLLARRFGELRGRAGRQLVWRNWPYLPGIVNSERARTINNRLVAAGARLTAMRWRGRPVLLWMYHPAALQLADMIPHRVLVYDCMDPFVAFRMQAGKDKVARQERDLLGRADVVFTGGRSLHEAKQGVNARTYCYPSGVDLDHFGRALDSQLIAPVDIGRLPKPVLGYWGAVDERIDWPLLDALCQARPDASVVLIGPLIGMERPPIDRTNFHYLGRKDYAQLPAYLKALDVCLMPFATSALTQAISPTKTPEYLAGGRPVVSTSVPDVIHTWGDVVLIAATPAAFAAAVTAALARPRPDLSLVEAARQRAMTWDQIARAMREKIEEAIRTKTASP
jgi:UDP-galactopyranose mutase